MYIIVAGCGKSAQILVKNLSNDGHDVVVIDPNEE
jgi:Trk K+ transport system NAD-binding subunit